MWKVINLNKKNIRRMLLPAALILTMAIAPMFGVNNAAAANPEPFFTIDILAPNSNPARNQWATMMVQQLPKIGIGVDTFDHTSWAQIYPRVFTYPGAPIPTYDEGGYDILFIGWSGSLDWDPTDLYSSDSLYPAGYNTYQWENTEFDNLLSNYTQTFNDAERNEYASQMQEILYDELPSITLVYDRALYPISDDVSGYNLLLWAANYQPMEEWEVAGDTELHYATPADYVHFHPLLYQSVYDAEWLRQIYNGLIERDAETLEFTERIASSYETTDGGMTWEVTIDPAATWSDGTPVTADDVKFTYEAVLSPELGSVSYGFTKKYFDNESITVLDDHTVKFELKEPYAFAESLLGYDLVPKHIWESIPVGDWDSQSVEWAKNDPSKFVGTGPFTLKDYDPTNGIINLEKNPHFDDVPGLEEPILDEVFVEYYANKEGAISALAAGTIDMISAYFGISFEDMEGVANADIDIAASPAWQEMMLNMEHPIIGTGDAAATPGAESAKHIRKAISHMVPRETIIEEILNGYGEPGVTACPDTSFAHDDTIEPYEYSIELAMEHMEAAGYEYEEETTTDGGGIGLAIIMSILALAGATQVFLLKRRK